MREEEMEYRNEDVGAKNPFALVEYISKKRITWDKMSEEDIRALFSEILGKPYEELFDPRYGSPLYSWVQTPPGEE